MMELALRVRYPVPKPMAAGFMHCLPATARQSASCSTSCTMRWLGHLRRLSCRSPCPQPIWRCRPPRLPEPFPLPRTLMRAHRLRWLRGPDALTCQLLVEAVRQRLGLRERV